MQGIQDHDQLLWASDHAFNALFYIKINPHATPPDWEIPFAVPPRFPRRQPSLLLVVVPGSQKIVLNVVIGMIVAFLCGGAIVIERAGDRPLCTEVRPAPELSSEDIVGELAVRTAA